MPNVKSARSQIDEIDSKILELLTARLKVAREVGIFKTHQAEKSGKSRPTILVPEREEEIFRRLKKMSDVENLPWSLVQKVFSDVIALCRIAQGNVTANVLGPQGTHSEWAARARFGGAVSIKYHESIPRAIRAAEVALAGGDPNSVAVVPLENSLEGTIAATADTLSSTSLKLVGEGYYRVRHALLAKVKTLKEVKEIYSHPMGLAQCQRWLHDHVPHAKLIEVSSTAQAAQIAELAPRKKAIASIASPLLESDSLAVLSRDIQDSLDNTTRFGILGGAVPGPTGDDKTSLVFSLPNRSGALSQAIDVFSKSKLNMTRIESRPHRGLQWEYLFFADLDGHAFDPKVTKALEKFDEKVRYFKILGTYPKGRPWN